jgi:hypothetical protein
MSILAQKYLLPIKFFAGAILSVSRLAFISAEKIEVKDTEMYIVLEYTVFRLHDTKF